MKYDTYAMASLLAGGLSWLVVILGYLVHIRWLLFGGALVMLGFMAACLVFLSLMVWSDMRS